jgi:hypothetical protein
LKRLLDSWNRNGSTSGPTPWQIDDDDDDDEEMFTVTTGSLITTLFWVIVSVTYNVSCLYEVKENAL